MSSATVRTGPPSRRRDLLACGAVVVVAALAGVMPAAAQTVIGSLVAEDTRQPIAGAVIHLLRGDERLSSSYSGEDGTFAVRAPAPGRYRLRAERIGFETAVSGALDIPADGLRFTFVVPVRAIRLDGIVVEAETQCRPTRDAVDVAMVWEEARKALDAVAITERSELVRSAIVAYERDLDAATLAPTRELQRVRAVRSRVPIRSLPAEELAAKGYVHVEAEGIDWYAPDAEVLLSDSFLATHCFRLREDSDRPGRIGLAFSPTAGARPDIEGVLWLDRASAELRDLEYRYTRMPWDVHHDGIGGRVAFDRVEGGPWIVREWFIRMPLLQRDLINRAAIRITSFRQTGSEVVDIVQALNTRVATPALAQSTTAPAAPTRATAPAADSTRSAAAPESVHALEGIDVEVDARDVMLNRQGFYERMANVVGGRFLTPEAIRGRNARRPSDLLETLPGIRLRPVRQGSGRVLWLSGTERATLAAPGVELCGPRVFIDDTLVFEGGTRAGAAPIDELVDIHSIAAVELYRGGASLPARYAGAESGCGVLLIWTGGH